VSWQEGYVKTGFSDTRTLGNGQFLSAAKLVVSIASGDCDAVGFTTGNESDVDFEELYMGWRNDLIEMSADSQSLIIGDGWLNNDDTLNFGEGFAVITGAPEDDHGGAYRLAAHKAFRQTAVLRVGGASGLRSDRFYLKNNKLPAKDRACPCQCRKRLRGGHLWCSVSEIARRRLASGKPSRIFPRQWLGDRTLLRQIWTNWLGQKKWPGNWSKRQKTLSRQQPTSLALNNIAPIVNQPRIFTFRLIVSDGYYSDMVTEA
jgi:hypothetical protein